MATVLKRQKVWYFDYALFGRRIRKAVGPSKTIAEFALKDIEVRIAKERAGFPMDRRLP